MRCARRVRPPRSISALALLRGVSLKTVKGNISGEIPTEEDITTLITQCKAALKRQLDRVLEATFREYQGGKSAS
eukprot:7390233-Pyramimonas_sp.AAC.1